MTSRTCQSILRLMSASRLLRLILLALMAGALAACNTPTHLRPTPTAPDIADPSSPRHVPEPSALFWTPRVHSPIRDLRQLLDLPEESFDLAVGLMLFARDHGGATPEQVEAGLAQIALWQRRLFTLTRGLRTHEERLDEMRRFLHVELRFRFDPEDPRGHDPRNLMFHHVLERRLGYCVTLSSLYVLMAPAARVKVSPIRLPSHFAVLDETQDPPIMLETTDRGLPVSRRAVYSRYRMSVQSIEVNGVFHSPIGHKEIFSTLYSNLAALAALSGKENDAERHILRALALAPKNIEARYNRATLLARRTDPESIQEALREVNEAIRLDPNFYRGFTRRAALNGQWGDMAQAEADLRRAFSLRADLPQAWLEQGVIRYRQSDLKSAKESFEKALELEADNIDALRNLSVVETELGNPTRARELEARLRAILPQ